MTRRTIHRCFRQQERDPTRLERRLQAERDGLIRNLWSGPRGGANACLERDLKRVDKRLELVWRYKAYPGGKPFA